MLLLEVASTVAILFAMCGNAVDAQFRVFRGDEENELSVLTDRERLEVAARTGGMFTIEITGPSQAAVVQEEVTINLDCLPWLLQNPDDYVIRWTVVALDEFGEPTSEYNKRACTCRGTQKLP